MRRSDLSREQAIVAVKRPIFADLEKVLGKDESSGSKPGLGFLPTSFDHFRRSLSSSEDE
jgi:hypothetical protein